MAWNDGVSDLIRWLLGGNRLMGLQRVGMEQKTHRTIMLLCSTYIQGTSSLTQCNHQLPTMQCKHARPAK
jgi:hypothetical protein